MNTSEQIRRIGYYACDDEWRSRIQERIDELNNVKNSWQEIVSDRKAPK